MHTKLPAATTGVVLIVCTTAANAKFLSYATRVTVSGTLARQSLPRQAEFHQR
jgi:hypothetical protein